MDRRGRSRSVQPVALRPGQHRGAAGALQLHRLLQRGSRRDHRDRPGHERSGGAQGAVLPVPGDPGRGAAVPVRLRAAGAGRHARWHEVHRWRVQPRVADVAVVTRQDRDPRVVEGRLLESPDGARPARAPSVTHPPFHGERRDMAGYVARRLIQAVPILFGVAVISFSLIYLAPGDPIDRFRTPTIRPEQLAGLVRLYGLDRPLPEQFWSWLSTYVQVWRPEAWGYSFLDGQPVLHKIAERLPATLLLGGTALAVTVVVAIPLGILAAVKQYSFADRLISSLATIGYA